MIPKSASTNTFIESNIPRHQPHILILDDQFAIRSLFEEVLSANRYSVSLARNLNEAIQVIQTEQLDAVIVDIFLSDKESGLDLLPSVRSHQPHTPVIVISGMASMDNVMEALKSGAYDMLCKPFNIVDMLHVVQRAVDKKRLGVENERLVRELKQERDLLEVRVSEATTDLEETIGTLRLVNEQITTMFEISQAPAGLAQSSEAMIARIFELMQRLIDFEDSFCVVYDLRAHGVNLTYARGHAGRYMMTLMAKLFERDSLALVDLVESQEGLPIEMFQSAIRQLFPGEWPDHDIMLMPLFVHHNLIGVVGLIRGTAGLMRKKGMSQAEERILSLAISHLLAGLEQRNYIARTGQLAGLGELIAEIAHDLRNPMTSIRGSSRMLVDGWSEQEKRVRCLDEIQSNLTRMESMVSELVNFYNPNDMNIIALDLHELMEKAIQVTSSLFESKKIKILRHYDPTQKLMILGLTRNLIEAFVNLYSNASHAMEEGGTLTLRTTKELTEKDRRHLEDSGRQIDGFVMATVGDNGCGIEEEHMPRIFRRFFTTKPEGHGLGLAAVQRIVKKNLGHITVESKRGVGTTFYLYLPKA